jgi:cytochrome b pre-mRNA-processing protein 3
MILPLFRGGLRAQRADTISTLYGMIVAQARLPAFYRDFGVPDTVDGRFELVVLHLALVMRRLAGEGDAARAFGQEVFDLFCRDMDRNLREIGISDLKVPQEMRRIGAAFYGRAQAYGAALAGGPQALIEAVSRNVYAQSEAPGAAPLATYMRQAADLLAGQEAKAIVQGVLRFPEAGS